MSAHVEAIAPERWKLADVAAYCGVSRGAVRRWLDTPPAEGVIRLGEIAWPAPCGRGWWFDPSRVRYWHATGGSRAEWDAYLARQIALADA